MFNQASPVSENESLAPVGHARWSDRPEVQHGFLLRAAMLAAGGAVFGVVVSMVVNVALIEVSMSSFFSVYFGLLFFLVGGLIIYRTLAGQSNDPSDVHQKQLLAFSVLVILSGVICFFLQGNWFMHLSWLAKVPVYTLLGISMSFALTFSLVDCINLLAGFFQSTVAKPLVQSAPQIRLIIGVSIVMGGIFGTIFGLLDIEDEMQYRVKLALLREQHYCYPIGALLGAAAGFGNEYLRLKAQAWHPVSQTDFDDDI